MEAGRSAKTIPERAAVLEEKAKEVRLKIMDMIHKAQSGHPGGSLSAADIVTALYFDVARLKPDEPRWPDRDRILLSKGHACPVVYACLAMRGFFEMHHLDTLRQFESILQGHPIHKTPGIDMTTGSLGHGLSIGLGMALDGKLTGRDFHVYVILGDGEINEGHVWEAAMAANKFKTDNLTAFVDRKGKIRMGTVLSHVIRKPPLIRDLLHMGKCYDAARQALGRAWQTIAAEGLLESMLQSSSNGAHYPNF